MTPVRARKNQYRGVNAHLHSFWQATKTWNRFHNRHISDLTAALRTRLIPMGYTADMDESLQIRRLDDAPGRKVPDVLISDVNTQRPSRPAQSSTFSEQALTLEELIEEEEDREHPYFAVVIYERKGGLYPGEPVAWIELLSPSNKGRGLDALAYRDKRRDVLNAGLVFVEIDYLHETPPTFRRLPDYTAHEVDSYPYRIAVLDPRPDFKRGQHSIHNFCVDDLIPTMTIPLNEGDSLEFDFSEPYAKSFEEMWYGYDVDYRQLPLNFDRYSQADQARIVARMLAVLKAAREGADLDANAPLPVEPVTLEDGLKQLETIQT